MKLLQLIKRYPKYKIVFLPFTPAYLRLNDGSDLDYCIKYKKHWWSRWRYITDMTGIPEPFSKNDIEYFKKIFEKKT